jgi:hypothetical protein
LLPHLVAHADWSTDPRKRWAAWAALREDGCYQVAGLDCDVTRDLSGFRRWMLAAERPALFGFDFPIGLPVRYAARADIPDFLSFLSALDNASDFYRVAALADDISLRRPFYPARPGGTSQLHLLEKLGLTRTDLYRRCDLAGSGRPAAAPLFWTMGAQQVGKAAIVGWRDVLGPLLRAGDVAVWPFSGTFSQLMLSEKRMVVEAYPAEYYRHLALPIVSGGSKRSQSTRQACGARLLEWAAEHQVDIPEAIADRIRDGFGNRASGEDPFDAVVGLFGMLNVLLGGRTLYEPDDADIRGIEGWIFGQGVDQ